MQSPKFKSRILSILSISFITFLALLLSYNRIFDTYELHTLDLRYRLRIQPPIDDKIVIIEISDDSIKKIGSWPFDRKYHGLLVKALKSAGARQIILDIFFSEEKEGDDELVKTIKEAGNVYMPYVFNIAEDPIVTLPVAKDYEARLLNKFAFLCKGTGYINIVPDPDGKFRRIPPFIKFKDSLYPHLGFLAAYEYLGFSKEEIKIIPQKGISLGKEIIIPLDLQSNIIVNFPGRWIETYRHLSYVDVLTSYVADLEGEKGLLNLEDLKDTICFVGLTATAEPDVHPSPFESLYPGVGIHASLFNSIISNKFISRASKAINLMILFILGMVVFITTARSKTILSFLYLGGIIFSFFFVGVLLFMLWGLWIDLFYPIVFSVVFYLGLTFQKYIVEMHKREVLENELSIAKNIQQSFLPKEKPKIEGIEVEAKMLTARQVGGDLYDFIDISKNKIGVMIGDVSGKGVPAALYMAKVVSEFRTYARGESPSVTVTELNNKLVTESGTNLFVTIFYLIFDTEKKTLNFSSGGHLPTLMFREGEKEARFLDLKEGMPLGLMEGPFSDDMIDIRKGDLFVLYTDGVTEAMNKKGEMFGKDRLAGVVKRNRPFPLKNIVESILQEVKSYEGRQPQHDDITVVAIRIG